MIVRPHARDTVKGAKADTGQERDSLALLGLVLDSATCGACRTLERGIEPMNGSLDAELHKYLFSRTPPEQGL